jgi:hypothetical protein
LNIMYDPWNDNTMIHVSYQDIQNRINDRPNVFRHGIHVDSHDDKI